MSCNCSISYVRCVVIGKSSYKVVVIKDINRWFGCLFLLVVNNIVKNGVIRVGFVGMWLVSVEM